ncbi:cytochrome P450 [Butyriboletus roseoflavus]|nr:cytochrome P450 [Butyriboletus roseoflavus]
MFNETAWVVLVLILASVWFVTMRWQGRRLPFPPGPRHFPLYGSVVSLEDARFMFRRTQVHQADNFARFGEQFQSDIIGIREWGNCTIVLNSFEAVNSILIRNSNRSAREVCVNGFLKSTEFTFGGPFRPPTWKKFRDWGGLHMSIPHLEYGEGWKARRQTFGHLASTSKLPDYAPVQLKIAQNMLLSVLEEPQNSVLLFHEMIGQVILTLVYGITKLPEGESHLALAERALGGILFTFTREFHIACFLNDLSRWIPLPEWLFQVQKKSRVNREDVESQTFIPYEETKRQLIEDNVTSSFVTDMLRNGDVDAELDIIIRDAAGSLYSGAVIATGSLLFTFMVAMAWFPEAQTKAQQELDTLLGHGNLPTTSTCNPSNIPYTYAVVMEMMRWRPPVWMGLDHSSEVDEEYNGHGIPARSALVANLKTILHDPKRFKDPQNFHPERFLKPDGEFDTTVFDPRQVVFGFGRRTCPGRGIAFTSLVIAVASTLACFDIISHHDNDQRSAAIASFLATDIPWYNTFRLPLFLMSP